MINLFRKRRLCRVIAMLLLVSLVSPILTPIPAYAIQPGLGGGQGTGSIGGGGHIQSPGVMVTIKEVENKYKNKKPKNGVDQLNQTLHDKWYKEFPDDIHSSSASNNYALVIRSDGSYMVSERPANYFVYGDAQEASGVSKNNVGKKGIKNIYEIKNRKDARFDYKTTIYDTLKKDKEKWDKFEDGGLTFSELDGIMKKKNPSKLVKEFINIFADTGEFGNNSTDLCGTANESDDINVCKYTELLYLVHYMLGKDKRTRDYITDFLKHLNRDDSENFYVIECVSVASVRNEAYSVYWYTYPTWMATCTDKGVDTFRKVTDHGSLTYRKDRTKFVNKDIAYEKSLYKNSNAKHNLASYRNMIWYSESQWNNRYALMPRHVDDGSALKGAMAGGSGYTFLARWGGPPKDKELKGTILLNATPDETKTIVKGSETQAEISIKLGTQGEKPAEKDNNLKDIEKKYKREEEKKSKPTLEIILDFDVTKGDKKSENAYDTLLDTKGYKLSKKSNTKSIIRVEKIGKEKLIDLLKGKRKIKLQDSKIKLNKNTTYRYKASATLKWNDGKGKDTLTFRAMGVKKDKENNIAYDYVKFQPEDDPPPKTPSPSPNIPPPPPEANFYSEMEQPYVELKEGNPGNETFEAMSGVPTTENLYAGFGATEFMLNMDVEQKESDTNSRTYSLKYTCTQCTEEDKPCTIKTKSHSHSHETGKDDKGNPITKTFTYTCGGTCGFCGGTDCPGDTHECVNKTGAVGVGCVVKQEINRQHPHSHTWNGKVTQPVGKFNYVDIKGLDLWQVNRLILQGNPELFSNPNQIIDPQTGYRTFFSQEGYSNGNGRLVFSFNYTDSQKYGNTTIEKSDGEKKLKKACDTSATDWMNKNVIGKKTKAKVISDYVVLTTTEGYQPAMYHEYESDEVDIATGKFSTGSESKSLTGPEITFSKKPKWGEMWENNKNTAAKWKPNHITRSGYNGNFETPSTKWNNTNIVQTSDPSKYLGNHPNSKNKQGNESFAIPNFGNTRMTRTGVNIIDSTDTNRNWSAEDGVEPIYNDAYDTGNCFIEADKEIAFNKTEGIDYATEGNGTMYREEVAYSPLHIKVNDIVVHNPVANSYATIISNDSKYDLRTEASLAEGGDPAVEEEEGCPGDVSCQFAKLTCKMSPSLHTETCYTTIEDETQHVGGLNAHEHDESCAPDTTNLRHIHCIDGCREDYGSCIGILNGCQYCKNNTPFNNNTYPNNVLGSMTGAKKWQITHSSGCLYEGQTHTSTSSSVCTQCGHTCIGSIQEIYSCANKPNTHACTPECKQTFKKVLVCDDPHHYEPGQPWDYNDAKNHYDFGDERCYSPCGNDKKHHNAGNVVLPNGNVQKGDIFINIDREFKVYYPDKGDFAQVPTMHGIAEVTNIRGMGYTDGMGTKKWIREKYAYLPVNVIDEKGIPHYANTPIDLFDLPCVNDIYTFYAVLGNDEQVNAQVNFLSIGNNAEEQEFCQDNYLTTNRDRTIEMNASHTAWKQQVTDVVGYIGALTMNDTGDFRFATLFKQIDNINPGWLIPNLVPRVNYKLPNKVVSDNTDVRQEEVSDKTNWHASYGVTEAMSGGKAFKHVSLPLTPWKNPIESLRKQPLRPGYQMYMDIETAGNYYGENRDLYGTLSDTDLFYKMQITPRYWELDIDTGKYQPVDVYMGVNGEYTPVVKFGNSAEDASEWLYYLDWLEESARRNYTAKEKENSTDVANILTYSDEPADANEPEPEIKYSQITRLPILQKEPIGSANRLFLNDLNRTFIGSTKTYGKDKNPSLDGKLDGDPSKGKGFVADWYYERQSQRWHFTLGLPSSSVFVPAGQPCTNESIKSIQDKNSVIVCALDIKVRGSVWTLEYDGNSINHSDGGGFKITPNGDTYQPPKDPDTGRPIDDPIVVVYSNKFTSKNDLRTEGSH